MPLQTKRGGGGIAPPIRNPAPRSGRFILRNDPAPPGEEGVGLGSGLDGTEILNAIRFPDRRACCELLCRLRYPVRLITLVPIQFRHKRLDFGM
jgi:hypothetical protein